MADLGTSRQVPRNTRRLETLDAWIAAKPSPLLRPLAGLLLLGLMLAAPRGSRRRTRRCTSGSTSLVEAACLGPMASPASDDEFLRRAYLDSNGTIPDAATARAFLDDAAPGKRAGLVDRLLTAPRFARHMQQVFDVMLMERRPQKSLPGAEWTISAAEWQEYLRKSFVDNKPLNQLAREILAADGVEPSCGRRQSFISIAKAIPICWRATSGGCSSAATCSAPNVTIIRWSTTTCRPTTTG